MLQRLRQAGLIWPGVLALAGLAVLIGLGTWQLGRKQWKEALIAKIQTRIAADPVPLARADTLRREGADVDYMHVTGRGRFHHDKERYFYAPSPAGLGWHVYTPLEIAPGRIVWINRGEVPDRLRAPETRPAGQIPGEVEVRGVLRQPVEPGLFTPVNDVARNLWHWPDVLALTASAFQDRGVEALPFVVDADAVPAPPGGVPKGGVTRVQLPNRHLEYALTWYGIALTLAGVFAAFAIARLRRAEGEP